MRIAQINSTCGVGSTGQIAVELSRLMTAAGVQNIILYGCLSNGYASGIPCAKEGYIKAQALKSRLCGNYGFNSRKATEKAVAALKNFSPDIVHLHNLHSHNVNLEMLFSYFKETKTRLVWTFHDCWAFTGYCPHFTMAKCGKWKTRCSNCAQRREYSWIFDKSAALFDRKKSLFQGLDLTIVTPSDWLAGLVKQSFLKQYPVAVIRNGIDLEVFKPTGSDFRKKYGLENKKVVLGVSFDWGVKKGLDVFVELARRLPEDYRVVLIGTIDATDSTIPQSILSLHRTKNQRGLAEIYASADVFVNPTREENYPTVNMEAVACGTPVVTFRTGGSPEMLDGTCGSVVACDDVDALQKEIIRVCTDNPFSAAQCADKARAFDKEKRLKEYLGLYEKIIASGD